MQQPLYGLPDSHIAKLQRIQNSAARLVTRTCFHDHITPVLQKLHWLPVRYRIMYKILILTYKCIHGLAPLYLQELIQEYKPTRNLRSSSKLNLISATVSTLMVTAHFVELHLNYGTIFPCMSKVVELYPYFSLLSRHTYSKLLLMIKFNCC